MNVSIKSALNFLVILLLITACGDKAEVQSSDVGPPTKIESSKAVLEFAKLHLSRQKTDTSKHDMSKPEGVQEIDLEGEKAWRVSWGLKNFTGKGGQIVVIVYESAKAEIGWG